MILSRGQISSVSAKTNSGYRIATAPNLSTSAANSSTNSETPDSGSPHLSSLTPAFPSLSPSPSVTNSETEIGKSETSRVAGPAITVTSSLAVVLGLFAALIWLTRKFGGRSAGQGAIPKDVVQNLGSVSIDPRTQVMLLRCGQRILIIARTNTGVHALGEITDVDEVSRLTAACLSDSKQAFASALQTIESEPSGTGYVGPKSEPESPRSRGRLFATA